MKLFWQITKILQMGLLLTFLLPFFPSGCKDGSVETADSANVAEAPVPAPLDTAASDTATTLKTPVDSVLSNEKDTTIAEQTSEKDECVTTALIERFPFMESVLRPNNTYTGLGYIVEVSTKTVMLSGVAISFVLWIFALIFKLTKRKGFHLPNIIGLLLLYFTDPILLTWSREIKLWGYWVCFWWATVMILFDLVIISGKFRSISK